LHNIISSWFVYFYRHRAHSISLLFFLLTLFLLVSLNLTSIRPGSGDSYPHRDTRTRLSNLLLYFFSSSSLAGISSISVSVEIYVTITPYIRQSSSEIHFRLSNENRKISVVTWGVRDKQNCIPCWEIKWFYHWQISDHVLF